MAQIESDFLLQCLEYKVQYMLENEINVSEGRRGQWVVSPQKYFSISRIKFLSYKSCPSNMGWKH